MNYSHLETEWHPTKNFPLMFDLSLPVSKKHWWIGTCYHEWQASLSDRKRGYGCPYCAGQKVLRGFNDFASRNPSLLSQWHPTKNIYSPYEIPSKTHKMAWWVCAKGHEWESRVSHRTNSGSGCPICSGYKVLTGFNDLATKNPELVAEWHPRNRLPATQVSAGSNKKVWWLCVKGHEWESIPNSRKDGRGCPYCSNKALLVGHNDLGSVSPIVAAQWHPTKNGKLTPEQVVSGAGKKVWWREVCGHEWESRVDSQVKTRKCPYCSGERVLEGLNDLATVNPAIAAKWHPTKNGKLTPKEVSARSGKKVWWYETCGHEWESTVDTQTTSKNCPYCSGARVLIGFNDLVTVKPLIAAQWHPVKNGSLTVEQLVAGSHRKVWWLCSNKHEWNISPNNRSNNDRCPICVGHQLLIGFNDLATTNSDIAAEWHPAKNNKLTPQNTLSGSSKKVWWIGASCGHEWEASVRNRSRQGAKCSICSGRKVLIGFNDFATTHSQLASEWHPLKNTLTAQQVTAGSNKRVWWLGSCGHEWESIVANRASGSKTGCPPCSRTTSKAEDEIKAFIVSLGLMVESSNRTILDGKEIDLWIPEKNVAIEVNGLYWHREAVKGRDRHYNKWLACKNKDLPLIQTWGDDWNLRPEIIMRSLAHKLGVSKARSGMDTKVISITEQKAEAFLTDNHLQGFASGSHYLGLVEGRDIETLQAVMALDMEMGGERRSLEIIRYATIANVNEDFSKMLSHVILAYSPEFVTGIADHCEADDELYVSNGFIAEKELPPDYMYVIRTERKPRSEYPLERFQDDPKLLWEEGLTEMELADLNRLDRIWDAGSTLYSLFTNNNNHYNI